MRFVAKCSYKILADIRQNLLEAKVCCCFVSSHGTYNGNFTVYSLRPITSEVYKMNTFSLNSVLDKNIYVVSTPKMHFPSVPAQDRFYFLNEGELQMNQGNSSDISMKQLLLISLHLRKVLSQHRQQSRFVSTSIRAAIRSFVCLKFSTLALLKAFIVKTSFSLSLKI